MLSSLISFFMFTQKNNIKKQIHFFKFLACFTLGNNISQKVNWSKISPLLYTLSILLHSGQRNEDQTGIKNSNKAYNVLTNID
ncbi:hypothetical protein BpHYR1_024532 [Brachionus plicatilis]|uniref:Uncharacterized protein n=1 Tax=Brachionus plicatilis TaxID=10195 RepID=A0A3M7RB07_BRAPC|nr:hypothetical protein BpHYR1_024532 [Brachionus plicatilis]